MAKLIAAVSAFALAIYSIPVMAAPQGFGSETTETQGNSGKPANPNSSESSQGTQETTTTGPKGALKNDKDTPNQETTSSGPGNSQR
jgi:hypothetical protein